MISLLISYLTNGSLNSVVSYNLFMSLSNPNCIIDARVSTTKQLDGNGLVEQKIACEYFAKSRNWNITKIYSKPYSGAAQYRADFEQIKDDIQRFQKKGVRIDYYLFRNIDRLTRLGPVSLDKMKREIEALGVQPIDTEGIIQPKVNSLAHYGIEFDWSLHAPSEMAEIVRAQAAKDDRRNTLTRMIGAEIGLEKKGFSMRESLDGYVNTKEMIEGKERSVLAEDKERSSFRKTMFEMRASGRYTDKEIVDHMNAMGFLSKPQKQWKVEGDERKHVGYSTPRQMTVKQMQKSIAYPAYAGVRVSKWTEEEPVWLIFADGETPIVSVEMFNQANRGKVFIETDPVGNPIVHNNYKGNSVQRIRLKYHPDYDYDKMVLCAACLKPLKNSGKGNRGKLGKYHQAHHCDRDEECKKVTGRIPKKEFEGNVSDLLKRIQFNDALKAKLEKKLIKKYREREAEVVGKSASISENVAALKREQQSLLNSIRNIKSNLVLRDTEDKIEKLEVRILSAEEQREKIEITEKDVKSFVKYAKDLVEHPVKMLANNRNPHTQKALFDLVFEEPLTYSQVVNGTPKLSFIFKLSSAQKSEESSMVIPRGIEPRFPG